jgi:hypothetical protein
VDRALTGMGLVAQMLEERALRRRFAVSAIDVSPSSPPTTISYLVLALDDILDVDSIAVGRLAQDQPFLAHAHVRRLHGVHRRTEVIAFSASSAFAWITRAERG